MNIRSTFAAVFFASLFALAGCHHNDDAQRSAADAAIMGRQPIAAHSVAQFGIGDAPANPAPTSTSHR